MISYADSVQILAGMARERADAFRRRAEVVPLESLPGRVLADDVASPGPIPPFDNAAMDGFAIRSPELVGPRRVLGAIAAGDVAPDAGAGGADTAWEIMTGAPVPPGYETVVRVEDTASEVDARGVRHVRIGRPPRAGENVRRAGEDFRAGDAVAAAGTLAGPEHVLALASLGLGAVRCLPRPKIAILATGSELVAPGSGGGLAPGHIYNSTAPYLVTAFRALGAEPVFHGIVRDDAHAFLEIIDGILAGEPDVIVTTGAVSMGSHDFIANALGELGARTRFHKVAIRPGKPLLAAELPRGPAFFGLPGNPVSTAVGLRFFVERYLRVLGGRPAERAAALRLAEAQPKPEALRCFFKAHRDLATGKVTVLTGQPSFMVSPLLRTNAWAILPEGIARVEAESSVETVPLFAEPYEGERSS